MAKRAKPYDDANYFKQATPGKSDGKVGLSASPAMSTRLPRKQPRTNLHPDLSELAIKQAQERKLVTYAQVVGVKRGKVRIKTLYYTDSSRVTPKQAIQVVEENRPRAIVCQAAIDHMLPIAGNLRQRT